MAELKTVDIGDLEFSYHVAGEKTNELVILLHGFPEASIMWSRLMDNLASLGYYCIAPDMRGYSVGACPQGVKNYSLDKLGTDILRLADVFEVDKFHLIGHDWGAIIGWYLTYNHPGRILSWTAMSVPHTRAFARAYKSDPVQKKKSRYVGFFLLPMIPEFMIRRHDFKWFRRLWKNSSKQELDYYLAIFRKKPSLTAALNYYRANVRKSQRSFIGEVETPTLFIWGNRDLAIAGSGARATVDHVKGYYSFLEVDGGHWLIQTNFPEVESAITSHLAKFSPARGA